MTGNSPKTPRSRSLSSTRKPSAPRKRSLSVKHRVSKATKVASDITNATNSPQSTPNKSNTNNSQKSSPKNSGNHKSNPPKNAKAKDSENYSGTNVNNTTQFTKVKSSRNKSNDQTKKIVEKNSGAEDDQRSISSDATPKRSTSLLTRVSVNFFVPPCENEADVKLYNAAKRWMTKLQECDKVAIMPWFDSDMGENTLRKASDIPTSLFLFKKYFQRANPKEEGGKIYTDVYLSHTKPIEEIKGDLSWWLKKEHTDIWEKEIQAESTARLGWLLFSFSGLNIKALCAEISAIIGIEIAGRFKPILTDKWDPTIDSKKRLKAIHLECDKKSDRKAKRELSKIYGSTSTDFPLGIRMRLIAEYRDVKGNIHNIKKLANLRGKQAHFCQKLGNELSEDILNLDVMHSKLKMTLREMIMGIQSWDANPSNLFHAVNESWKGDRIVFSFTPYHEASAKMIVDGIIPYLRFKYGNDALDFFTPDACLEKDDWAWDDAKKLIHNPLSKDLDDLEGGDADYDFSIYGDAVEVEDSMPAGITDNIPQAATNIAQTHLDRVVQGLDDDSISTLGNGTVNRFTPRTIAAAAGIPRTIAAQPGRSPSSGVSLADQSIATMDSRVSHIEKKLDSLESNISASIAKSMEDLLKRFSTPQKPNVTPTGGTPGAND